MNRIKKYIPASAKLVVRKIVSEISLIRSFLYDYRIFRSAYTDPGNACVEGLRSWLLQDQHRIEKAFTLPYTKSYFGEFVIRRLVLNYRRYVDLVGEDWISLSVRDALKKYLDHSRGSTSAPNMAQEKLLSEISLALSGAHGCASSIVHEVDVSDYFSSDKKFDSIVRGRSSVRDYSERVPTMDVLTQCVELALETPSVCNRRHYRVGFVFGEMVEKVLLLQNGNAGFRNKIKCVGFVCSDARYFVSHTERKQGYVDGGMFLMSLLNSFHFCELTACSLNWSASVRADKDLHTLLGLPSHYLIVSLFSVGYANEKVLVTESARGKASDYILEYRSSS